MYIQSLYLYHFRLYSEASFSFMPGLNIVQGDNASGKTTLLEAVYFFMTGKSFRTLHPQELIHHGASYFFMEIHFVKHGVEQKLKISCNGKDKKIIYNSTPYNTATSLLGLLQGVVMTPDDLMLIKGSPQQRRHFLDLQISQVDPLYVHYLYRYQRAMRHRNVLLKARQLETMDSWEYEMASAADYLVKKRSAYLKSLQPLCHQFYAAMTLEQAPLGLEYKMAPIPHADELPGRQDFIRTWQKNRTREMEFGSTFSGPHKDDFLILLGERSLELFGSEGQQRSCIAALRLAEWELLKQESGELPLLLFDDVGLGLDSKRTMRLLELAQPAEQVLLTTAHTLPMPVQCTPHVIQPEPAIP